MKILLTSLLSLALISDFTFSEEGEGVTTDSLAVLIQSGNNRILDEVLYEDPTANKTMGVMFNPIATIMYEDGLKIIGGFSYFPKGTKTELSLNLMYKNESDDNDYTLNIDVLNRFYFDRKYRKGFHLISGLRLASYRDTDFPFFGNNIEMSEKAADMLGVSFGIGYRILNRNGWYWGTSMYVGRYLVENDKSDEGYNNSEFSDSFIWMELLKFGYIFK